MKRINYIEENTALFQNDSLLDSILKQVDVGLGLRA